MSHFARCVTRGRGGASLQVPRDVRCGGVEPPERDRRGPLASPLESAPRATPPRPTLPPPRALAASRHLARWAGGGGSNWGGGAPPRLGLAAHRLSGGSAGSAGSAGGGKAPSFSLRHPRISSTSLTLRKTVSSYRTLLALTDVTKRCSLLQNITDSVTFDSSSDCRFSRFSHIARVGRHPQRGGAGRAAPWPKISA